MSLWLGGFMVGGFMVVFLELVECRIGSDLLW
jgi:hypothetical protein